MAYMNLKGTTEKSFKIGPNGVVLSTKAIVQSNGTIDKYLLTNQKDGEKDLYLALTDQTIPIYDTFISSSDIKSLSTNNNNELTINLRNGSSFKLSQTFLVGPESSTDGAIALFDGTDGKKLKDSQKKIVDEINDQNITANIPSVAAVVNYVGVLSDALKARLEGKI